LLKLEKYGVNKSIQAYCMLILTTFCWGLNAVFARMTAGEISPMLLVSIRWLGTLVVLVLFARRTIVEGFPVVRQHMGYTF